MNTSKKILLCIFLLTSGGTTLASTPDSIPRKNRLKPLLITTGAAYATSLVALNELWYSNHERESFHFFNDGKEWQQMDKVGHFFSAFHLGSTSRSALKWAGVEEDKALLYGSLASTAMMASIELFDGFSSAYGASFNDLIANASGTLLFYGQQQLWNEVKIHPKFSFRRTGYSQQRPKVLGENLAGEILKDYNGQTYWLSMDLSRLIEAKKFPKWLNLAVGYGAEEMIFAEDHANIQSGFSPTRQYYLALDFDLNEYQSSSTFVNMLIYIINMIHLPAPALEYSSGKLNFHFFY